MPAYVEILDSEIDPESPGTTSLFTRLRDNPIAIIEGASGAPRATSKIITPGGSSADGALVDATDLSAAGPGFYEFSSITLTASKALPWITRMRVNGDVSITGCDMSPARRPLSSTQSLLIQNGIIAALRGISGGYGGIEDDGFADGAGGGGGAAGAGGHGANSVDVAYGGAAAIPAAAFTAMNRGWIPRIPLLGCNGLVQVTGADDCRGGGALILLVNGDMIWDTATIDISGQNATTTGSSSGNSGAGAGSCLVICNGNIHIATSLTVTADGGDGIADGGNGGGGGGGLFGMIAASFTGVAPTVNVAGGSGPGGAANGDSGVDLGLITLSEEIINSMMLGAVA